MEFQVPGKMVFILRWGPDCHVTFITDRQSLHISLWPTDQVKAWIYALHICTTKKNTKKKTNLNLIMSNIPCRFKVPWRSWYQRYFYLCLGLLNSIYFTAKLSSHWGRDKMDDIWNHIFFNENVWIAIKISLKFVPKGPVNNVPALV